MSLYVSIRVIAHSGHEQMQSVGRVSARKGRFFILLSSTVPLQIRTATVRGLNEGKKDVKDVVVQFVTDKV